MPKIVDHEERKNQILRRALWVFVRNGYNNTSLADIADICGISRPTLYQYFNDKSDIFYYTLKYTTDLLQQQFLTISRDTAQSVLERLQTIAHLVLRTLYRRKDLIAILFDFLISLKKEEQDFLAPVRRRTIRFQRLLAYLVQQGVKKGEIAVQNPVATTDTLFAFFESYFMHVAILEEYTPERAAAVIIPYLNSLKAHPSDVH